MPDARLGARDEVEVLPGAEVQVHESVLFVVGLGAVEFAVEADKYAVVHGGREIARRHRDLHWPLALGTIRRQDGLEGRDRLDAGAADDTAGPILGVVLREPEVFHRTADGAGR